MSIDREFRVKHGLIVDGDVNFTGTLYQNGVEFSSSSLLSEAVHAITIDDGMLVYTKTLFQDISQLNLDIDFNDPANRDVGATEANVDLYNATTGLNENSTDYDQYFFGSKDVFYFIDDDGYMVMRVNDTYTYTEPK